MLKETVRAHDDYPPSFPPLPHPSWRSRTRTKRNPWLSDEAIPTLRQLVYKRRAITEKPQAKNAQRTPKRPPYLREAGAYFSTRSRRVLPGLNAA